MIEAMRARTFVGLGLLVLILAAAMSLGGCQATTMIGELVSAPFEDSPSATTGTGMPKRVVVVPFRSTLNQYAPRSLELSRSLGKALQAHKSTVLVDHRILEKAVSRLTAPGATIIDQQLYAARLLGINTLVRGAIIDISVRRQLEGVYGFRDNTPALGMEAQIVLLDAGTGTQLGDTSIRRQVEIDDVMAQAIELGEKPDAKMLDKLLAQLQAAVSSWVIEKIADQPWVGVVLAVDGGQIKVTGGSDNGLAKGAELLVYMRGEPIKTGAGRTLYLTGASIGRVRLDEVGRATSWAKGIGAAKKDDDKVFRPGQIVRIP